MRFRFRSPSRSATRPTRLRNRAFFRAANQLMRERFRFRSPSRSATRLTQLRCRTFCAASRLVQMRSRFRCPSHSVTLLAQWRCRSAFRVANRHMQAGFRFRSLDNHEASESVWKLSGTKRGIRRLHVLPLKREWGIQCDLNMRPAPAIAEGQ